MVDGATPAQPTKTTKTPGAARIKKALSVALVAGLALLAFLWLRHERRHPADRDGDARAGLEGPGGPREIADRVSPSRRAHASPVAPSTAPGSTVAPPIIDAITVEKAEVCEGEENLVTVRAHTTDGNDPFLHFQIGPTRGSSVGLRSFLDNRGNPTAQRVVVFSRNNAATSVEVPSYRVKKCDDFPVAVIAYRLLANTWADFELDGKIVAAVPSRTAPSRAPPFRPRLHRWSFGDGATAESASSAITHSFATRPQDTLYSSFLVTLEVVADDGRIARARQALELLNPAFEAFATKHIVQLMVDLDPRFPVLSENGMVHQGVRLWHARPQPVEITTVTLEKRRIGAARPAAREHPAVASVLGATVIPPGRGLETRVALDAGREPDTVSHDYTLEGRTPEGYPVRGTFSVMRPPRRPTAEQHQPIQDPVLVAKIKRARELLHAEYVTDEDLRALERAGRFDGLEVDPAPPAAVPDKRSQR